MQNAGKVLTWTLTGKMLIVGMVIGFIFVSAYAIPLPPDSKATGDANYLTFQSTCTNCHEVDRIQNYRGSATWPEIVELMVDFGGFFTDSETEQVVEYLESAYPR